MAELGRLKVLTAGFGGGGKAHAPRVMESFSSQKGQETSSPWRNSVWFTP
jgi:hypothetical protein